MRADRDTRRLRVWPESGEVCGLYAPTVSTMVKVGLITSVGIALSAFLEQLLAVEGECDAIGDGGRRQEMVLT